MTDEKPLDLTPSWELYDTLAAGAGALQYEAVGLDRHGLPDSAAATRRQADRLADLSRRVRQQLQVDQLSKAVA